MFGFGKPKWEKLRERAEQQMERQQWALAHNLFADASAKAPEAYQKELLDLQNQCADEIYLTNVEAAHELLNTDPESLPGYQDLKRDRLQQGRRSMPTQLSAAIEHYEIALRYATTPEATEHVESRLRQLEAAANGGMTSLAGVFFVEKAEPGQWYYRDQESEIVGPLSLDSLGSLVHGGVIEPTTIVQCHDTVGPAELNNALDGYFHVVRQID